MIIKRYPAWVKEMAKLKLVSKEWKCTQTQALDKMIRKMYKEAIK